MEDSGNIRRLGAHEVDDVFVPGELSVPAMITPEVPVSGELMMDARGHLFLSPMPDERAPPRMAVLLRGPTAAACAGFVGEFVVVAGRYDPEGGFQVTHIGRHGGPPGAVVGAAG